MREEYLSGNAFEERWHYSQLPLMFCFHSSKEVKSTTYFWTNCLFFVALDGGWYGGRKIYYIWYLLCVLLSKSYMGEEIWFVYDSENEELSAFSIALVFR